MGSGADVEDPGSGVEVDGVDPPAAACAAPDAGSGDDPEVGTLTAVGDNAGAPPEVDAPPVGASTADGTAPIGGAVGMQTDGSAPIRGTVGMQEGCSDVQDGPSSWFCSWHGPVAELVPGSCGCTSRQNRYSRIIRRISKIPVLDV
jgi:hypothetical protein